MGYESRLYIVTKEFGIKIASIDMCKMGNVYNWNKLFKYKNENGLYDDFAGMGIPENHQNNYINIDEMPDVIFNEDKYGDELKYANIDEVIKWCAKYKKEINYKRINILHDFLKSLKKYINYEDLIVVHFGY